MRLVEIWQVFFNHLLFHSCLSCSAGFLGITVILLQKETVEIKRFCSGKLKNSQKFKKISLQKFCKQKKNWISKKTFSRVKMLRLKKYDKRVA